MKKYMLGFICIVLGVGSIGLLVFIGDRTDRTLKDEIHVIDIPRRMMQKDSQLGKRAGEVIRDFLQKMDSLRKDGHGRVIYDSICKVRPGLMDSARVIDRFLQEQ